MVAIDLSPLTQTVTDSMVLIVTALIGLGVFYLRKYVISKIDNEELKNSLLLTLQVVQSSVNSAVQGMGGEVKVALSDGKITNEELEHLKAVAKKQVSEQISPALQKRLQAHVNDVDKFIEDKVKEEVLKIQQKSAVIPS